MFTQSKIESLQLTLKSLALYDGKIDGVVGPLTLSAIKMLEALMAEKQSMDKPVSDDLIQEITAIENVIDQPGSNIDDALIFTLKNEGGYTNHPADGGRSTNKGITLKEFSQYLGRNDVTEDDLKDISIEMINIIYKKNYWDVLNLGQVLDQSIATAIFDMGVLCGPGTSLRLCQEVLGINPTKKINRETLELINNISDEKFIPMFVDKNIEQFNQI
ncbi:glycosyl hydrolase 108 family protein, partial [Klebsiella variicola]